MISHHEQTQTALYHIMARTSFSLFDIIPLRVQIIYI